MNPFVRGLIRSAAETFTLPGPILEVGSRVAAKQDLLGTPRTYFPGRDYVGLDIQPGTGVDVVGNVEALPQPDASFGTVIALETLEHVERFWVALEELQRVLRPDGVMVISVPFYVHIHNHPADYWRFTPTALDSLLGAFPNRLVGYHGAKKRPTGVWAIAFGPEREPPTEAEVKAFRQRVIQYGHWRLNPLKVIRYTLGWILFGRRAFERYLCRNQFEFTWQREEVAHERQPLAVGTARAA